MISDRIKDLRKELNLKQSDFANKIGIKQAAISAIEKGIRNVTDRIINDICREFNVNEEWLRNGTGEMFAPTFNDKLDQLATEYNFSKLEYTFFSSYLKLDEKKREAVTEFLESIVKQSLLYDFYGELLTDHQRSIYEDVVYNDMSLSEIAEENGISRQGVHDLIKRCDKTLSAYEEKLHLISKFQTTRRMVEEIHKKTRIFKETKDENLIDEIEQISNDIMEL